MLDMNNLTQYQLKVFQFSRIDRKIVGRIDWGENIKLRNAFTAMKQRCSNPNHEFYADYGGRGIAVCAEWVDNPYKFIWWALNNGFGKNAKRGEQDLDRIDNDLGYSPTNCRFISHKDNCNNKREHLPQLPSLASYIRGYIEYGEVPKDVIDALKSADDSFLRKAKECKTYNEVVEVLKRNDGK